MLSVLTWLWAQPGVKSAYTADHVNLWATMIRRNLTLPHRIACVTDMPAGIDPSIEIIAPPRDFEAMRIPTWAETRPQCLRRLVMFAPDAAATFGERIVCMDLDCVIGRSLDPLFVGDHEFKICQGSTPDRPYNGSIFMLRAGSRPQVFEKFTREAAIEAGRRFLGSDQAWISHILPREKTWGEPDGVYFWNLIGQVEAEISRVTFFPGTPKPWDVVLGDQASWVVRNYRTRLGGRCLVVGNGTHVWTEVAQSLKTGRFDRVIVSPEVKPYWQGEALVAPNDAAADRLVSMLGFDQTVYCGRRGRE